MLENEEIIDLFKKSLSVTIKSIGKSEDLEYSFKLSFLNRCDELEKSVVNEYYQRAFGIDLSDSKVVNVRE